MLIAQSLDVTWFLLSTQHFAIFGMYTSPHGYATQTIVGVVN
ncbi:hypothetical protein [Nodularia spumigena]|nr:hypothetical protein [Nodularia spumigena]MDB9337995.1 hypothetical protein [Nodularia spumigena CS-589/07]MDB9360458.1 hypothetical protein [Nodularia spumigena CS-588/02]MDB9366013.1 hypothetical protein [Nodularia spumigena CS-588/02A10]MDB9530042.1 hypothetical protein [Nodularia spumigena CS-1038]MDB9328845.1 hypothetical protein [Nodularia spumigena CS-590/02]